MSELKTFIYASNSVYRREKEEEEEKKFLRQNFLFVVVVVVVSLLQTIKIAKYYFAFVYIIKNWNRRGGEKKAKEREKLLSLFKFRFGP